MVRTLSKRAIVVLAIAVGLGASGGYAVYAPTGALAEGYPPIVEKLAERFGLDRDEVLDVFKTERRGPKGGGFGMEKKLDRSVEQQRITAEQKDAVLAKIKELWPQDQSFKELSPEERKQAMIEARAELKSWAEANNIDLGQVMPAFNHRMMGRDGHPGGKMGPRGGFDQDRGGRWKSSGGSRRGPGEARARSKRLG
jgi:hypothetical protein